MNSKLLCANLRHCVSQLIYPSQFTSLNGASGFVDFFMTLLGSKEIIIISFLSIKSFHFTINNNQSKNLLKYRIVHCTPITADANPDGKKYTFVHTVTSLHTLTLATASEFDERLSLSLAYSILRVLRQGGVRN
jgi:hypothetical protein